MGLSLAAFTFVNLGTAKANVLDLNRASTGTFTTLSVGQYQFQYIGYGDKEALVHVGSL